MPQVHEALAQSVTWRSPALSSPLPAANGRAQPKDRASGIQETPQLITTRYQIGSAHRDGQIHLLLRRRARGHPCQRRGERKGLGRSLDHCEQRPLRPGQERSCIAVQLVPAERRHGPRTGGSERLRPSYTVWSTHVDRSPWRPADPEPNLRAHNKTGRAAPHSSRRKSGIS